MRADRLISMLLLLQARGRMTAKALSEELEVSVRTIYRDLDALSGAGIPVFAESGPGGGCQLLEGYRWPLSGVSKEEVTALLTLGVPQPIRDLGLGSVLQDAHRKLEATVPNRAGRLPLSAMVLLDMPAWFRTSEKVPSLPTLADAIRQSRRIIITYERPGAKAANRTIDPLGLVNKASHWYLVGRASRGVGVYRVSRISRVKALDEHFEPPSDFDLASYWSKWSEDFETSRPKTKVTVRVAPQLVDVLPEVFGESVRPLLVAGRPDEEGWISLVLTFEHERAAVYRLAGFGPLVKVLSPAFVRNEIVKIAKAILASYESA